MFETKQCAWFPTMSMRSNDLRSFLTLKLMELAYMSFESINIYFKKKLFKR